MPLSVTQTVLFFGQQDYSVLLDPIASKKMSHSQKFFRNIERLAIYIMPNTKTSLKSRKAV